MSTSERFLRAMVKGILFGLLASAVVILIWSTDAQSSDRYVEFTGDAVEDFASFISMDLPMDMGDGVVFEAIYRDPKTGKLFEIYRMNEVSVGELSGMPLYSLKNTLRDIAEESNCGNNTVKQFIICGHETVVRFYDKDGVVIEDVRITGCPNE